MLSIATKKRIALAAATTALIGSALMASTPANADPAQLTAAAGVGSDTIQDISNAFQGFHNGIYYTPVHSSAASGNRQIISFDAVPPAGVTSGCITTKTGGPTFNRPFGSSQGRRALSRALDGTGYGNATCGGPLDISGQVDFARSSAGPTAGDTGTTLTYIPFARDGVTFGYYRASGGAAVTSLTKAQLVSLFTTGPQVIGGVNIIPCGIQTGSGTFSFWNTALGITATQENTATATCNALFATATSDGRSEENNGDALKARGDLVPAGSQVIIGFSGGVFAARSNGVAGTPPPATVGMGAVTDNGNGVNIGAPVTFNGTKWVPSATFYNDATFGRSVYYVLPTSKIASAFGNDDLKTLFSGPTSAICQQSQTIQDFGFTVAPNCGSLALKGSLLTGQL